MADVVVEPEKRPAENDGAEQVDPAEERRKKRRSRWGNEDEKAETGIITTLPSSLSKEQQEAYLRMYMHKEKSILNDWMSVVFLVVPCLWGILYVCTCVFLVVICFAIAYLALI